MGYILGLGGNCCDNCTSDNPCLRKPILTACSSGSGTVGVYGSWLSYTSGTNLGSALWAQSGAPAGVNIDTNGYLVGTPTESGTFNILIVAYNDCGQSTCYFTLTISCPAISGSYGVGEAGITGADNLGCFADGCSTAAVCFSGGTVVCGGASPNREPDCVCVAAFTCYLLFTTSTATTGNATFKFYVDGALQVDTGAIGGAGSNSFRYTVGLGAGVKNWCCTITSMDAGVTCSYTVSSYYI